MPSLDPSLPEGTIVCLDCDYQLQGLTKHRCPECGRAFDPENERSFYVITYTQEWVLKVALGAVYGLLLGIWLFSILSVVFHSEIFFSMVMFGTLLWVVFMILSLVAILAYLLDSQQPRGMKLRRASLTLALVLASIPLVILAWYLP